jgi:hypothetical protein
MPLTLPVIPSDNPVCQIRRTTTYSYTGSFADVTMDATDVANDTTSLAHDGTNTQRINILAAGTYLLGYAIDSGSLATARITYARIYKNGTTVVPGSGASQSESTAALGPDEISNSVVATLAAGDYITLQVYTSTGTVSASAGASIWAVRLTGAKGDTGPSGPGMTAVAPVTAGGTITTTSTSDVLATGMTSTPAAGTYLCFFTGGGWLSNPGSSNYTVAASIYAGGSQVSGSEIQFANSQYYNTPFSCVGVATVNGSQAIEGRWRVNGGGGTATITGVHTLLLLKIG